MRLSSTRAKLRHRLTATALAALTMAAVWVASADAQTTTTTPAPPVSPPPVPAQQPPDPEPKARLTIYGHVQQDTGYDFGRINPDYFDRLRVSVLPTAPDEFGKDGSFYFSARQTRFGLKSYQETDAGELFAQIEFDLVGSGSDAGKTIPRLRHAYGSLGAFGAGQYWSPFTDVDTYPTIFESFGPTGLPWVRNLQVRWMPMRGATKLTLAVEKPGASGEGGDYAARIELQNVQFRARSPEYVVALRHGGDWGHLQGAVLVRRAWWDDLLPDDQFDLNGNATGWGVNLSSMLKFGAKNVVRLQYLMGEGVENYVNDSTVDIAPEPVLGDPRRPIKGVALPVQSATGYLELFSPSGKLAFVVGGSWQDVDNVDGQSADAFSGGTTATATLIYYRLTNMFAAVEYQFGQRRNFSDGWRFDDNRVQFTVRWAFSADLQLKP